MTAVPVPRLELTGDYLPMQGARATELRAYARMIRMVGRSVPQPAAGAGNPVLPL